MQTSTGIRSTYHFNSASRKSDKQWCAYSTSYQANNCDLWRHALYIISGPYQDRLTTGCVPSLIHDQIILDCINYKTHLCGHIQLFVLLQSHSIWSTYTLSLHMTKFNPHQIKYYQPRRVLFFSEKFRKNFLQSAAAVESRMNVTHARKPSNQPKVGTHRMYQGSRACVMLRLWTVSKTNIA